MITQSMQERLTACSEAQTEEQEVGDINGGGVDLSDAILILRIIAGIYVGNISADILILGNPEILTIPYGLSVDITAGYDKITISKNIIFEK